MSRPKWEPTERDIEYTRKLGGLMNQKQLADFFGISERTIRDRMKEVPEFRQAYERGRAETVSKVAGSLVDKALKGNLTAMTFYLKTQAGWQEKQRIEHTGADGGAIEIETPEAARRDVMGRLVGISKRLRTEGDDQQLN